MTRAARELGHPQRTWPAFAGQDGSTVPDVDELLRASSRTDDFADLVVRRMGADRRPANAVLGDISTGRSTVLDPGTLDALRPFREQADSALGSLLVQGAIQGQRHMPRSPRTTGNTAELLVRNEQLVPRLLEDIANAKRSISLTQYNWEPNGSGRQVLEALQARAGDGLDVRIIVDSTGFREPGEALADDLQRELEATGARVERSDALRRLEGFDHRKVAVIDDRIAYAGGIGLGEKYGPWTDHYARVEGPAAAVSGANQLGAWRDISGEVLDGDATGRLARIQDILRDAPNADAPAGAVTVLENRPGSDLQITESFLDDARQAQHRLWATSTYATSAATNDALIAAAHRGVDVRLMVSGPGTGFDAKMLQLGSLQFDRLRNAGVQVFERTVGAGDSAPDVPSHMHAKGWIADDVATVGSMNHSYSSLRISREAALRIEDPDFVRQYVDFFEDATSTASIAGELEHATTRGSRIAMVAGRMFGLRF